MGIKDGGDGRLVPENVIRELSTPLPPDGPPESLKKKTTYGLDSDQIYAAVARLINKLGSPASDAETRQLITQFDVPTARAIQTLVTEITTSVNKLNKKFALWDKTEIASLIKKMSDVYGVNMYLQLPEKVREMLEKRVEFGPSEEDDGDVQ